MSETYFREITRYPVPQFLRKLKATLKKVHERFPDSDVVILTDGCLQNLPCRSVREISEIDDLANTIVIPLFEYDEDAVTALRKLIEAGGRFYSPQRGLPPARFDDISRSASVAIQRMRSLVQKYELVRQNEWSIRDFLNIMQSLEQTRTLSGCYLEIGSDRGDSMLAALCFAEAAKIDRNMVFADTFEGFNYEEASRSTDVLWETHLDRDVSTQLQHLEAIQNEFSLQTSLARVNICRDPLPDSVGQIAVCNIDVDMYEAIVSALDKVHTRVVSRGVIIVEDYGHSPMTLGAQVAVSEFLESVAGDSFVAMYMESGQMFLTRR